ncbi:Uncharacterised protein [Halioglobus japonicus]|nr:Uncharacterised protein [Halioglobus japonicus]
MLRKNRRVRYIADRASTAYWLLKQGDFREFMVRLSAEAGLQFEHARNRIIAIADSGGQSQLRYDSNGAGRGLPFNAKELDSEYIDRRKLQPPSYRPTGFKRIAPVNMQADPEVVKGELRAILSSFSVRERG